MVATSYGAPLREVDAQAIDGGVLSLSGDWGSEWMAFTPLSEFERQSSDLPFVHLPAYLYEHVDERVDGIVQGYATYAIRISRLASAFDQPTLYLKNSHDAWQVWWVEDNFAPVLLGENGRIGRTKQQQKNGHETGYVQLPSKSQSGTLVIYVSAYYVERSGLGSKLEIVEHDDVVLDIIWGVTAKALIIGIGLFIAVQNIVFYSQRRTEPALLILSLFTIALIIRTILTSSYIDFILAPFDMREMTLRLEYIDMVWAGLAIAHFVLALFPIAHSRRYIVLGYGLLIITVAITFYIPVSLMTQVLSLYQIVLLVFVTFTVAILSRAMLRKSVGVNSLVISAIPLLMGLLHDIVSTRFAGYNFFVTEYALIIFLFIQTQIQLSRFVRSLDVAEHLTENLQYEVDLKTQELSARNEELEKHTLNLKIEHKHVKLLSETDHLTGLYNRQTLEFRSSDMFTQAITYGLPLSVVMMDLDHFKKINDIHGHSVGDECLIHTGSYLRAYQFRKRDLIARYGGEEIVIILSDIPLLKAEKIINRVCTELAEAPVSGDHENIYLTASFGIADIESSHASSITELIKAADDALYLAKKNGRNRVEIYTSVTSSNDDANN
jgi:diguanylate cyclase (GGDEF)-like protein